VYVGRVWVVPTRLKIRPPNCRAPVASINNQSVLPATKVYPIPLSGEMPDCRLGDIKSPEPYDLLSGYATEAKASRLVTSPHVQVRIDPSRVEIYSLVANKTIGINAGRHWLVKLKGIREY